MGTIYFKIAVNIIHTQHLNFSSKAVSKIIAEAEAKKNFVDVIKEISVFALAIPLAVFGSYFGNVVLFN